MKRLVMTSMCAAAMMACAQPSPEMRVVNDAAAALGGKEKIMSVRSVVLEGTGENFNLGQGRTPDGDLPMLKVDELKRRIDFVNNRWRLEQVRTPTYLTGDPRPQKQFLAVDGNVAFNVGTNGAVVRQADRVAKDRRSEVLHYPIAVLRLALTEKTPIANARQQDNADVVNITSPEGDVYELYVDRTSRLPSKVVSRSYHANLGDIAMETEFGTYQDIDGLRLPTTLTSKLDETVVARARLTKTTINGDVADLVVPPPIATSQAAPVATNVSVEEVAPGVWYLAGQSHHSVVAEFSDHLTLFEAPLSEARTLAVIAKARELRPDKPLTQVIPTHHHFDHTAGIRAAVAEGLTIITDQDNRKFFEDVVGRQHTIVPDALARSPKPLKIETFDGVLTLKDDTMAIEVYPIEGNPHVEPFLMAFFPKQRLLFEADAFSPPAPDANPAPAFPFAPSLLENITRRQLKVERVLAGHGRIVPVKDLMTAATLPAGTTGGQ